MPKGSWPPEMVFRKFIESGWYIHSKADSDLCHKCRDNTRRPPPQAPSVELLVTQLEKARQDNRNLQAVISRFDAERRELREEVSKANDRVLENKLTMASAGAKLTAARQTLRKAHEMLISNCPDLALAAIEAHDPSWPWERRLPKKQGSAVPKRKPAMPDKDFDQWLTDLEKQRMT